jgi:hypothetical protein
MNLFRWWRLLWPCWIACCAMSLGGVGGLVEYKGYGDCCGPIQRSTSIQTTPLGINPRYGGQNLWTMWCYVDEVTRRGGDRGEQ